MTDRPTDLSSLPSYQAAPALAVLCTQVRVDGLGRRRPWGRCLRLQPVAGPGRYLTSPAHAQVNNEVRKVAQPIGFADIVERVKPSVISVKVNINEKVAKEDGANNERTIIRRSSRARRWSASSAALADRTACRRVCAAVRADMAR